MKKRRLALLGLLCLGGCASIMPNAAAAIAPATFGDLALGIAADVENWIQYLMLFLGI